MNIDTKTFLYTLLFAFALIAIGITLLRKKETADKEKAMNYKLCGIFSVAIGIMFGIYRTMIFFVPQVAEFAGLFIIVALIVINILLFRFWKKRDKNKNLENQSQNKE